MAVQRSEGAVARLGILMLETRFPRIPGDVGNPETWPFPVRYAVVRGASAKAVIRHDQTALTNAFVAQGRALVADGCRGIATTCGFLAPMRSALVAALGVPVAASALEQAAQIVPMLGAGQRLGVLTIEAAGLGPGHLRAAGVPEGTPVRGMDGTNFARTILEDRETLDISGTRSEMVAAGRGLVHEAPEVGAIILECTNMVPYATDVAAATGRPVFSIYTYLRWFHESLAPRGFGG